MTTRTFSSGQTQPLFTAVAQNDASFQEAYASASRTLPRFIEHVQSGIPAYFSAKLRFRDPDESERLGEDRFLFLWLTGVHYYPEERVFSGSFLKFPRNCKSGIRLASSSRSKERTFSTGWRLPKTGDCLAVTPSAFHALSCRRMSGQIMIATLESKPMSRMPDNMLQGC